MAPGLAGQLVQPFEPHENVSVRAANHDTANLPASNRPS